MKGEYIYTTKVPYWFLLFMAFGTAFFVFLLSLIYPIKIAPGQDISPKTASWIAAGFSAPFAFLAICCFYGVVGFKLIYLTSDELIIRRPLLMYRRIIDLTEIDKITEKAENVKFSHGLLDESRLYSGKKAIILLTSGRKIRISSLQITEYTELIDKICWRMSLARRKMRKQSF